MIDIIVRYIPKEGSGDKPYFMGATITTQQLKDATDVDALISHQACRLYEAVKLNSALKEELE